MQQRQDRKADLRDGISFFYAAPEFSSICHMVVSVPLTTAQHLVGKKVCKDKYDKNSMKRCVCIIDELILVDSETGTA